MDNETRREKRGERKEEAQRKGCNKGWSLEEVQEWEQAALGKNIEEREGQKDVRRRRRSKGCSSGKM